MFSITDSDGKERAYHIECQSNSDSSMGLRMAEYDLAIGMFSMEEKEDKIKVRIPKSAVLWLGGESRLKTVEIEADGRTFAYAPRSVKMKSYRVQDIVSKNLYALYPFLLFNIEKEIKSYEKGSDAGKATIKALEEIADLGIGDISEYDRHTLLEVLARVLSVIGGNNEAIVEEGERIMGGRVMELKADKILNIGILQGIERGIGKGVEENRTGNIIEMLKDNLPIAKIAQYAQTTEEKVREVARNNGFVI